MITRFAPSPTGPLHLGHAWAAMVAADHGEMRLRIEDIDPERSKPRWEAAIRADLEWLGLPPAGPVMRQSERTAAYAGALDRLWAEGLLYPCTCSRRDVWEAAAPQEGAPLHGPDGVVYPGTCRSAPRTGPRPEGAALRLDAAAVTEPLSWEDDRLGPGRMEPAAYAAMVGDVVVARRGWDTSYHLAVVVDDAAQEVGLVTRGEDLADATPIHVTLQRLLGLPTPGYLHHDLVRDGDGRRLAKRDDARSLASYREAGWSAEALKARLRQDRTVPAVEDRRPSAAAAPSRRA
ncbi:tRNA glutamyl-Q(34) synthetase GluQRS [Jannaschia sp. Os4]|uniref:tRNA glutamyl-Q(34) synthetase GluQRS n=1 Tax=Jannaschia sp. Os4 TaxID=2807617 RepID=UPI001939428F|nr:tRNA glutamyl-Q(34) synthetase GluQRS [Jannaschia sp. Os4]MBM2576441.1 tRNA glutamyl-Q(34) synthetase GluQRS [Jannaschia sp. Os4]